VNDETLARVRTGFLDPNRELCAAIDDAIRGRRGRRLLPVSVLFGGMVYLMMERRRITITEVARCLRHEATAEELAWLAGEPEEDGPAGELRRLPTPSRSQLYRVLAALKRVVALDARSEDPRVRKMRALFASDDSRSLLTSMANALIAPTAPALPPDGVWATDTTYLNAFTRPIAHKRILEGERASDPDARWRVIQRDDEPPKMHFGYQIVAIAATNPSVEYVRAIAVARANERDDHIAENLVERLQAASIPIRTLIVDRGFSQHRAFLADMRNRDVSPAFDLRRDQDRRTPNWRGCLVLDGWPYLPSLPRRLWSLPRPAVNAPEKEKHAWRTAAAERERYALVVKEWLSSTAVRVVSPVFRRRQMGCKRMPHTVRTCDPTLAVCPGDHGPDDACCLKNGVWRAERAPWTYQCPAWGSRAWQTLYARRSAIERRFNMLKNADCVGFASGRIRWRGLPAVTLLCALGWVAHNLQLAAAQERKRAKAPPPPRARAA